MGAALASNPSCLAPSLGSTLLVGGDLLSRALKLALDLVLVRPLSGRHGHALFRLQPETGRVVRVGVVAEPLNLTDAHAEQGEEQDRSEEQSSDLESMTLSEVSQPASLDPRNGWWEGVLAPLSPIRRRVAAISR